MDKISKCKSRAYKILTNKQGVNIVVTADSGDTFFHRTQMQEETVKIDKLNFMAILKMCTSKAM